MLAVLQLLWVQSLAVLFQLERGNKVMLLRGSDLHFGL